MEASREPAEQGGEGKKAKKDKKPKGPKPHEIVAAAMERIEARLDQIESELADVRRLLEPKE